MLLISSLEIAHYVSLSNDAGYSKFLGRCGLPQNTSIEYIARMFLISFRSEPKEPFLRMFDQAGSVGGRDFHSSQGVVME